MDYKLSLAEFQKLANIVEAFRTLYPRMEAQTILILLHVATFEGLSQDDLANRVGTTQTSISRNLGLLSSYAPHSMGLVALFEDPMDRRRKLVSLTQKGKAFLLRLKGLL